jgi:chromosome condensin MukBEF MukE localization factor
MNDKNEDIRRRAFLATTREELMGLIYEIRMEIERNPESSTYLRPIGSTIGMRLSGMSKEASWRQSGSSA